MRALVYTAPGEIALAERPEPVPAEGEALVAIEAVGICGSDMHAFLGHDERRPPPLVLGHEAAGTVLTGPLEGRRVTVNPLVTCGRCEACRMGRDNICPERQIISMAPRPGAFAERIAMPERNLVEIPDDVPAWTAALAEPIACGWHAVRLGAAMLDRPLAEARCLVIGGGAIGFGAALALRAQGAEPWVAETNPIRHAALAAEGFALDDGALEPHLAIDAVGVPATRALASARLRPGGAILHIGLGHGEGGLDTRRMTLREITFTGTYTYTAEDFRQTALAIFDGRLGRLDWPERRPLADGPAAFAAMRAGRVAAPKIVLEP